MLQFRYIHTRDPDVETGCFRSIFPRFSMVFSSFCSSSIPRSPPLAFVPLASYQIPPPSAQSCVMHAGIICAISPRSLLLGKNYSLSRVFGCSRHDLAGEISLHLIAFKRVDVKKLGSGSTFLCPNNKSQPTNKSSDLVSSRMEKKFILNIFDF